MSNQWFDTHLHLFYPAQFHYDWTADFPTLQRRVDIEQYRQTAPALGITTALYMEVDVREDEIEVEIDFASDLAGRSEPLLGGLIAACRPEGEDELEFARFAARCHANPMIRGFRRILHTQPNELSRSPVFRRNLAQLTARGHPFELIVRADQLPLAIDLADALPEVPFVLNHMGNPNFAEDGRTFWEFHMSELARRPNVACKVSGVVVNAGWSRLETSAITESIRPYFEQAVAGFGWDRVVWGSDFPVCDLTTGLPMWKEITNALIAGASKSEVDALAWRNARRIYRIEAPLQGAK